MEEGFVLALNRLALVVLLVHVGLEGVYGFIQHWSVPGQPGQFAAFLLLGVVLVANVSFSWERDRLAEIPVQPCWPVLKDDSSTRSQIPTSPGSSRTSRRSHKTTRSRSPIRKESSSCDDQSFSKVATGKERSKRNRRNKRNTSSSLGKPFEWPLASSSSSLAPSNPLQRPPPPSSLPWPLPWPHNGLESGVRTSPPRPRPSEKSDPSSRQLLAGHLELKPKEAAEVASIKERIGPTAAMLHELKLKQAKFATAATAKKDLPRAPLAADLVINDT